jgi:hypothetical protein
VERFDGEKALCIEQSQQSFKVDGIKQDLAFIQANFGGLIPAIKMLQTKDLQLSEVAPILLDVKSALNDANGEIGLKVKTKFENVLIKNPGFKTIQSIGRILAGHHVANFDMAPKIIHRYKFAPLTSSDVERSFSIYKNVFTDRRTSFTHDNLEMYLITNCERNYSQNDSNDDE